MSADAADAGSIKRNRRANLLFMTQYRISQAATLLGVSDDTVRRWVQAGRLSQIRDQSGRQTVDGIELARLAEENAKSADRGADDTKRSSARNRAVGLVTAIHKGDVAAQVDVQCGPFRFVSLMTREAVDDLGLQVGDTAAAVVKATTVIIERAG